MDAPDGALRTADAILEKADTLRQRKRADLHEEWQVGADPSPCVTLHRQRTDSRACMRF